MEFIIGKAKRLYMKKIGQFKEYKGYVGSIEYDEEDELYYGKLFIENATESCEDFEEAD